MAALFETFRASSMPKRLLRYALSRLDLLDAETLDMENLDLALGRTNTLEFRDAGIKLEKLRKLLELPPSFQLLKAKVAVLRITIPIDFYTSPITVEVDGVDVRLKFTSKDETPQQRKKREKSSDTSEVVPNPVDLAESFLEQQPPAERKELEEALAAETQDMGASLAMSDYENDDESHYGTGQALSLPTFMADFLQGIVDRVQVSIHGVTFQVDVEVLIDNTTATPELVTLQLSMDGVNVEGVTVGAVGESDSPKIVPKEGKRLVSLDNIRACLITETNVFSSLARSPSMPSSLASRSPSVSTGPSFSREASITSRTMDEKPMVDSQELDLSNDPMQDSEDAFNIPYEFDAPAEDHEDQVERAASPASSLSTPRASLYQGSPASSQSPIEPIEPAESQALHYSTLIRGAEDEPDPRESGHLDAAFPWEPMEDSVHSSPASDTSSSGPVEDLAQSHLFSHEEAESMYMSAFSQTESTRLRSAMPGGWDSPAHSPESSPKSQRIEPRRSPAPQDVKIPEIQPIVESAASEPLPELPHDSEVLSGETHVESALPEPESRPVESGHQGVPDEVPQDGAATPRGSTRLVKEIISMKTLSIYIPSNHQHIQVSAPSAMGKSVAPNVPGAFSVHSSLPTPSVGQLNQSIAPEEPPAQKDNVLEVMISPLEVRFDASIGFLVARVIGELLASLQTPDSDRQEPATASVDKKEPSSLNLRITGEKISLLFLDKLSGVADTAERILGQHSPGFQHDVLLQATLENLKIETVQSAVSTETVVDLERFRFGYANADIISFDRDIQMRTSVRDVFPPGGADVSMKLMQYPDVMRCEINTLPLLVQVDLQRLDETFSWFGGLSSFLGMGSSMASTASVRSPVKPTPKPRGVRFDTPQNPATPASAGPSHATESKIDLRIGGMHLGLIGKDCSVSLNTSAVKVASRQNLLGVTISKVRLSGPNLRNSRSETPVVAEISNTRLEYQPGPRDADLERLLELITPSKVKFDDTDDVIMVDTLLRQRRKGPILRLTSDEARVSVRNIAQLQCLPALGEELARLGTVAKYLPEDDRPGLLVLGLVRKCNVSVDVGGRFGSIETALQNLEVAQITIPSLIAIAVGGVTVTRNQIEDLIGSSNLPTAPGDLSPVLMVRIIGDEIEPVIKVKMRGVNFEYRVSTIMDVLDLADDATPQDFEASLAASVANLGDQAHTAITGRTPQTGAVGTEKAPAGTGKPTTVDLAFRDCIIGLNPLGLTSKLNVVLVDAQVAVTLPKDENVQTVGNINKASLLLIDDISTVSATDVGLVPSHTKRLSGGAPQSRDLVAHLCAKGFVNICQISSAKVSVKITPSEDGQNRVNVDFRDDLLVLETCADSTQTLIGLANALTPPTPPSKEIKFKTEVMPVKDLLASISIDAFGNAEGNYNFEDDFALSDAPGEEEDPFGDYAGSIISDDDILAGDLDEVQGTLFDASASNFTESTAGQGLDDASLMDDDDLSIHENHFGADSELEGTAHRWNSAKNTYDHSKNPVAKKSPFRVRVRDVHVIWNLFDGYDWQNTRDVITKTVHEVEAKAYERRSRAERRAMYQEEEEEEETVIGDFLFNSIYIGIPANHDPRELTQAINQNLYGDRMTETESVTTTVTATPSRAGGSHHPRAKKLKLQRSRHHKITFELRGLNVDLVAFPPGSGETQNSVDVRVQDLEVFDHVPTSTWKKFATYDQDAGERQLKAPMVHLELLNVRPVPGLAATEIVLRVTVLPLRLHVDQDALDFITRFFEFKDDSAPVHASPSDIPFIQRAEVNSIPVQLDFKPKRVDYAGLRSGHTTEFMNFLILESSRMTLRHTIIYGTSGFDRLGKTLNDIWMPDVKRHQLPGVLAGLAPVRSLVNVGSGFKDLIEIPIREYQRDGRIVRSISKGAAAFAKTTGTELVKLGAKVATGTQYVLQGAEGMLVRRPETARPAASPGAGGEWEEDDLSDEERKQISLYADQPTGVVQGLRHAYTSLARDLNTARDAIIAVPAEVRESSSAKGAAKAVMKRAPTIIFRPAIGATKAIGQTLLGATNTLDPQNLRRMEDKYKSGPGRL